MTQCFDRIKHDFLLTRLPPQFRPLIRKWLKAGVVEFGQLQKSEEGTPQGGVISPLLANIALDPIDHLINRITGIQCIRYADDVMILSQSKQGIKHALTEIQDILRKIGPELNFEKTRVSSPEKGFTFLGFHFIRHTRKSLWVQPDTKRVKSFLRRLKDLIRTHKQVKTEYLILGMNQRIRGWANYYRFSQTHSSFSRIQHILFRWIWRWVLRRHPKKSRTWALRHYYALEPNNKWRLTANGETLLTPFDIKRLRYNWRVGNNTKYDSDPAIQEKWRRKREGGYYTNQT